MKNLLLRACLIALAFLSMPSAIAPATAQGLPTVRGPSCFSASGPISPCIGMFLADPLNGNPITPSAAPSTYTLLTAATPSPASTPPAGTYKLLLPATFNGATITLSITSANGTVSTFAYTSVPSPIPCFPIAAGDTVSAAASGGTPTGNTVFAGATRCGSGDVSPASEVQYLGTGTAKGGTIATGGTAQTLAAANTFRRAFTLQNRSGGDLWINETGGTAIIGDSASYQVPAGGSFAGSTNQALSIIGATTGQAFTATETK